MIIIQATQVLSAVHFTLVGRSKHPEFAKQNVEESHLLAVLDLEHDGYLRAESLAWAFDQLAREASCELGGTYALTWEAIL